MAAGPLFSIQADPVEAVAAVYFPHFLDLGGMYDREKIPLIGIIIIAGILTRSQ